ncbi:hypothetical protein FO488_19210 [Geobacter sp. FeAm09]|uniref:hypothetical protein n=1 Tax=Geobacter sp. FeAm09 TaxID=2597769 RepID=UPI0011F02676|nr:hypothetical protein [Geobacter sp. FeAm09]QEM70070.1 hypothetical protein FO488_19210 [Geobacter sp. FeAm09]
MSRSPWNCGNVTSGLKYYYPTTATSATISMAAGYTSTVKVDGITQNPNYTGTVGPWTSGSHSVEVAYSGTAATTYAVTITQTTGGTVSIKLPNGTSNSSGASGVSSGTSMPITISAAAATRSPPITSAQASWPTAAPLPAKS